MVDVKAAAGGVTFKVTADTRALSAALTRLQKTGGDAMLQTALKSVGEVLLNSTHKRWNAQVAPDGTPWAPLNPLYKAGKKGSKIMQASGQLFASTRIQITPGMLQLGTNKIYAAAQHFGAVIRPHGDALVFSMGGKLIFAKKVTIPARPLYGMSATDRTQSLEAVAEVYDAGWGGTP